MQLKFVLIIYIHVSDLDMCKKEKKILGVRVLIFVHPQLSEKGKKNAVHTACLINFSSLMRANYSNVWLEDITS
jgi:hypothetical protein